MGCSKIVKSWEYAPYKLIICALMQFNKKNNNKIEGEERKPQFFCFFLYLWIAVLQNRVQLIYMT